MTLPGLDGGSTYLKAALIGRGQVIDTMVRNTGIDNDGTARKIAKELCRRNSLSPSDIGYIMATGYSRKVLEVADDDISEITAHAYGVRLTAPKEYRPGMIIDIGGQDSKIIYLDGNYGVKNFSMNDKCAAGTGKFMEVIAQILETTIDNVGPLSLQATNPCDINSTCVVFAQSEVISLVARKYDRCDILAGMHLSMAKRIIKMMKKSEKGGDILMTGGGALNTGLHHAFEEELMRDVYVANYPQFNGAIGELTTDNAKFTRYNDTTCYNYLSFKYTWTKGSLSEDDTVCVRAYLEYKDADGSIKTVYSKETKSASLGNLITE